MGAKACLILSILLLSYIVIPADVAARELLQEPQTAEELKSDIDGGGTTHKALKGGPAASKGQPYREPGCQKTYTYRGGGHPGHVITPIKPVPAPIGKPYNRPGIPYSPPRQGKPYNRPGIPYNPRKGKPYKRPVVPYNPPRQGKPYNRRGIPYNPPRQGKPDKRPGIRYNPPRQGKPDKRPGIRYNPPRQGVPGHRYHPCPKYRCRRPAPKGYDSARSSQLASPCN